MINKTLAFLFFIFSQGGINAVRAQIITTIAGNGTMGYAGDGGSAVVAELKGPEHVCFDGVGNLYISDVLNQRIRKVSIDGSIMTIVGGGSSLADGIQATAAMLTPKGIAVDGYGNLYIADYLTSRIRKVDTSGVITTVVGTGVAGYGGDGGLAVAAQINRPFGIALDAENNMYIGDDYSYRFRKVDTAGIITTIAGTGTPGYSGDDGPATAAKIQTCWGIAIDPASNIYIADYIGNNIRKIDTSGIITTIAGNGTPGFSGDGGLATAALLYYPIGISLDNSGNIYFCDQENNRIRMINTSGVISTIGGNGIGGYTGDDVPATATELGGASGIAFDCAGNLFIADYGNNRVRMIAYQHSPFFTAAHTESITVCENTSDTINSLLAIIDSDLGQTETWSMALVPSHGTVVAGYTTASTGGILTPAGLTYMPTTGYTGNDTFKIQVSDCGYVKDTATVYVTIANCALKAPPGLSKGEEVVRVLPNPNEGSFMFCLSSVVDESVRVVITNMVGEKVKEITATTNKQTAITLDAPAGVYFLSATTAQGRWSGRW